MRFPIAAIFFLAFSFIFFICWIVSTYIISTFHDTLQPLGAATMDAIRLASYNNVMATLPWAFGFLCVLFFIIGLVVVFVLESWSDEPEYYYR